MLTARATTYFLLTIVVTAHRGTQSGDKRVHGRRRASWTERSRGGRARCPAGERGPLRVLTHYPLTTHSLFTRYSLTTHSLLTHYSLTTHSLLTHYSLTTHAVLLTTHAVLLTTHDDTPHYDTPHYSTHAVRPDSLHGAAVNDETPCDTAHYSMILRTVLLCYYVHSPSCRKPPAKMIRSMQPACVA